MSRFALIVLLITLGSCSSEKGDKDNNEFEYWIDSSDNQSKVLKLQAYLRSHQVEGVFPIEQVLRSDVRWNKCKSHPFTVPPEDEWPNILPTLEFIRDEVKPLVGNIEVLSVYRNPKINKCIGGASKSNHMRFFAIDMKPVGDLGRQILVQKLCQLHKTQGLKHKLGLGIYKGVRFHIDTAGYRTWGQDYKATSSPCLSNVAMQH